MQNHGWVRIAIFLKSLIHLGPRNTRLFQLYSLIIDRKEDSHYSLSERSQIILTCCDSLSPNQEYTNMANIIKTYTTATCNTSVWSPQLCQMKDIIISGYSVKPWAYEDIIQQHAAVNTVEEGVWLIKANEP